MKCSAIGKQTGHEKIIWYTSYMLATFFKPIIENLPQPVVERISQMQSNDMITLELQSQIRICALKLDDNVCVVCCDTDLSAEQMNVLHQNIFVRQIPLAQIYANFESYCTTAKVKNSEIESIKKNIEEVRKAAGMAVDKAIDRQGQLEEIQKTTQLLHMETRQFRQKAEELNRCWPEWMSYCNLL